MILPSGNDVDEQDRYLESASCAGMPTVFVHDVNSADYGESWVEGLNVFHNPHAKHPLHPAMIPGAAHHWLHSDGQPESGVPQWQPFVSTTEIYVPEP